MPNLQTSAEILDDILFRAGEKTDGTSDYEAQGLIYMNRAYRAIYMGGMEFSKKFHEDWYWNKVVRTGSGALDAVIKTGTVTATRASTAITFSSAPAVSVADRRFLVDGDEDIYTVSAHTAGAAAATLLTAYTGTTGAGKTFRVMRHAYALISGITKIASPIFFYQDGGRECLFVDFDSIRRFWASGADLSGVPERFCYGETESEIYFDRYGSDTENEKMLFEYSANERPADLANDSNEPIVPRQWRHIISDMALFFIYADKDDSRGRIVAEEAQAGLEAMKIENRAMMEQAGEVGHIYPRGRPTVRRVKTSSGKLIGYFR